MRAKFQAHPSKRSNVAPNRNSFSIVMDSGVRFHASSLRSFTTRNREEEKIMKPCGKCLENNWTYKFNEGIITATCEYCGSEVMFEARKKHPSHQSRIPDVPRDDYRNQDAGDDGKPPW